MVGGDEVILKDGVYTGSANQIDNDVPSGTAFNTSITGANGNYTTIRAENDHGATLNDTGFKLVEKDNILIQGLRILKTGGKLDACEHITIRRCGIHLTTTSTYGITFGITATYPNYTVKAKRILLEESWFWGEGRYAAYFHITEHCVARRCVFRTDAGQKPHDDPNSGFALYGAQYSIVENCIVINTENARYDGGGDVGGFYVTSGSSGFPTHGTKLYGNIALNLEDGKGFSIDPQSSNGPNAFENNVSWHSQRSYGLYGKNLSGLVIKNNTLGFDRDAPDTDKHGGADYGSGVWSHNLFVHNNGYGVNRGSSSSNNNNSYGNCVDDGGLSCSNYGFSASDIGISEDPKLKYITDASITIDGTPAPTDSDGAGDGQLIGAQILNRYENGVLTSTPLWPFPNEDWIKQDFADASIATGYTDPDRGFCAGGTRLDGTNAITLTSYVWEYIGYPVPEEYTTTTPPTAIIPPYLHTISTY